MKLIYGLLVICILLLLSMSGIAVAANETSLNTTVNNNSELNESLAPPSTVENQTTVEDLLSDERMTANASAFIIENNISADEINITEYGVIVNRDDGNIFYFTQERNWGHQPEDPIEITYEEGFDYEAYQSSLEKAKPLFAAAPSYETVYDLRKEGRVADVVRLQNPYGTCWIHAAIASIESNILSHPEYGESASAIDLSEFQLVYFFFNRNGVTYNPVKAVSDVLPGLVGDNVLPKDDKSKYDEGGSSSTLMFHLAAGMGAVPESVAPYDVIASNKSAMLDPLLAVEKDGAYLVTSVAQVKPSAENRNTIKGLIKSSGGGVLSYWSADHYKKTTFDTPRAKNQVGTVYYQSNMKVQNHDVCVVGWNDEIPASAFEICGQGTPAGNGAWLIRNSWGKDWHDDGYFWLSYYDASLQTGNMYFYNVVPASAYDFIYQYDGGVATKYYLGTGTNKYTANGDQIITAVSYAPMTVGSDYTITVTNEYTHETTTVKGKVPYAGYITVPLNKAIIVKKGDKFSVTIQDKGGIGYDVTYDGGWYKSTSAVYPDQCYENGSPTTTKCFRIKAFGNDVKRTTVYPTIEIIRNFNAVTPAEIRVTYQCPDSVSPELCDKADYYIPKYVTNPNVPNGASMYLSEYSGFASYAKNTDYTYNKSDSGRLTFSGKGKAMRAKKETFVFRSEYCLGDVNMDGKTSGADATMVCNSILSEYPFLTTEQVFYGKTKGGVFNPTVLDAINIAKYPLGLVDANFDPI